uniref:Uncharacterized protein n=1 Tax=Sphaerodactylus townsendi TaxID=933632 RepID=A0ACB8EV96_9SAUR
MFKLTYGSASVMRNISPGYSIYQMAPNETLQYVGIMALLLHFKWTWESFFASREQHSNVMHEGARIFTKVMESKSNVFVVFGQSYSVIDLRWLPQLTEGHWGTKGKVYILSSQMDLISMVYQRTLDTDIIHGVLSFTVLSRDLPKFQNYIMNRNPSNAKGDGFIKDFWQHAFNCVFQDEVLDELEGGICTGKEKLESLPGLFFEINMTSHSYGIYRAVYAVAP